MVFSGRPYPVFAMTSQVGFPCGSAGKESTRNTGDLSSIPGLGRSPGERKGYPLQYSGLESSMDCIVHGIAQSRPQLSDLYSLHPGGLSSLTLCPSPACFPVSSVPRLCRILCDPMDYTVHGILQARILEWVAFPFSRGSSHPGERTQVSCLVGRFFTS